MLAESKDVTRLTIELTRQDLDRISKGAMIQSTVCEDDKQSFLLEIYCSLPPGRSLEGKILEDWD